MKCQDGRMMSNLLSNDLNQRISRISRGINFANTYLTIDEVKVDEINITGIFIYNMGKNTAKTWRLSISVFNLLNNTGITEGSPQPGNNQTITEYFVGSPILFYRIFAWASFNL